MLRNNVPKARINDRILLHLGAALSIIEYIFARAWGIINCYNYAHFTEFEIQVYSIPSKKYYVIWYYCNSKIIKRSKNGIYCQPTNTHVWLELASWRVVILQSLLVELQLASNRKAIYIIVTVILGKLRFAWNHIIIL